MLFRRGISLGASDIHIEPFEGEMRARARVDGRLVTILATRKAVAQMVASRIKVMASLDIAEKRLPQDGRIALRIAGRLVDVRVSTLPGPWGERVVLRILDKRSGHFSLDQIGLRANQQKLIDVMISRPTGILLVTGPTGSGKTTTLYAMMAKINSNQRNIITVEDPIEYELPGIGQIQVNTAIGMTFARCLRAILRQDPDIILVGEIRDAETAEIAVQASLTGHLVLSTLHTNSAVGAVTRLRDMGVESFLLSSTLTGLIAQRLVRLICPRCGQTAPPGMTDGAMFEAAGIPVPELIPVSVGCSHCTETGYRGRTAIYETVLVTDEIREKIHNDMSEREIEQLALGNDDLLRNAGLRLIADGRTTIEEVLSVTQEK